MYIPAAPGSEWLWASHLVLEALCKIRLLIATLEGTETAHSNVYEDRCLWHQKWWFLLKWKTLIMFTSFPYLCIVKFHTFRCIWVNEIQVHWVSLSFLKRERHFPRSEYWHGSQEQQYFYYVAQGGIFRQGGYWGELQQVPLWSSRGVTCHSGAGISQLLFLSKWKSYTTSAKQRPTEVWRQWSRRFQ